MLYKLLIQLLFYSIVLCVGITFLGSLIEGHLHASFKISSYSFALKALTTLVLFMISIAGYVHSAKAYVVTPAKPSQRIDAEATDKNVKERLGFMYNIQQVRPRLNSYGTSALTGVCICRAQDLFCIGEQLRGNIDPPSFWDAFVPTWIPSGFRDQLVEHLKASRCLNGSDGSKKPQPARLVIVVDDLGA
jgi:hypothetical protein